jgi:NitT/TauT family transport system ATP-binding protein
MVQTVVAFFSHLTYTSAPRAIRRIGAVKLITSQALVQAHRLSVTYQGNIRALEDINLELPPGQFVSLVGPSGCGKSTILRLVAGLVAPSAGTLTLAGEPPQEARRKAVRLAFVFQDPTLLPWRCVASNVALPLELAGQPRPIRDRAATAALEMVGLADFANSFPGQLSGGMRMRVSLARGLVVDPELLLLDEPFAALDDITRQKLNEELSRLWEQRRWTGLFVTHNIAEAVFLSQRILVMSARPGRIVADVAVQFDYPRRMELRAQPEFARLCGQVMESLQRAGA